MIQDHRPSIASAGTPTAYDQKFFSIPIGRLGPFSRILMGGACGFIAFFIAFFFAIIGFTIYDSATGRSMDNLNLAYLEVAAPVGIAVMLIALTWLLTGWARQKFSARD